MRSKKNAIANILGLMRDLGITIDDLRRYEESESDEDEKEFVCEYRSPDDDTFGGMAVNEGFFNRHKDPSGLPTDVDDIAVDDDFGGNE